MSDLKRNLEAKQNIVDTANNVSETLEVTDEDISKALRKAKIKTLAIVIFGVVIVLVLVSRMIYG